MHAESRDREPGPHVIRTIADQTVGELGGRISVLSRQRADHEKLDDLLGRLEEASHQDQLPLLLELYRLVFPHAFAEEAVLWPLMRRVLADGQDLTVQVEQEHQEVNEIVTRLETLELGSGERQAALDRLADVLREDVRDEEDELFPRLQAHVSVGRLRSLGVAWEIVRRIAPTRAHPIVARRPPGNVIAALPLSILDRSRDRLDAWRLAGPSWAEAGLRATTVTLTRAAHALEHLGPLRQGEDPSTAVGSRVTRRLPVLWVSSAIVIVTAVVVALTARGSRRCRRGSESSPR